MNFHRNNSYNKVADYCKEAGIHFKYTDLWDKDEQTFRKCIEDECPQENIQAENNNYGWERQNFRKV